MYMQQPQWDKKYLNQYSLQKKNLKVTGKCFPGKNWETETVDKLNVLQEKMKDGQYGVWEKSAFQLSPAHWFVLQLKEFRTSLII